MPWLLVFLAKDSLPLAWTRRMWASRTKGITAGWRVKRRVSRLTQMARRGTGRPRPREPGEATVRILDGAGRTLAPVSLLFRVLAGTTNTFSASSQAITPRVRSFFLLKNSQFHKGYTFQTLHPSLFFFWANTSIFPSPHLQIMSQSHPLILCFPSCKERWCWNSYLNFMLKWFPSWNEVTLRIICLSPASQRRSLWSGDVKLTCLKSQSGGW